MNGIGSRTNETRRDITFYRLLNLDYVVLLHRVFISSGIFRGAASYMRTGIFGWLSDIYCVFNCIDKTWKIVRTIILRLQNEAPIGV